MNQARLALNTYHRSAMSLPLLLAELWRRKRRFSLGSCRCCRGRGGPRQLDLPFPRIRPRLGTIEVAPSYQSRAGTLQNQQRKKDDRFHIFDASKNERSCQRSRSGSCKWRLHDTVLARDFCSVRGYGLRAYESRQGRNAATVV